MRYIHYFILALLTLGSCTTDNPINNQATVTEAVQQLKQGKINLDHALTIATPANPIGVSMSLAQALLYVNAGSPQLKKVMLNISTEDLKAIQKVLQVFHTCELAEYQAKKAFQEDQDLEKFKKEVGAVEKAFGEGLKGSAGILQKKLTVIDAAAGPAIGLKKELEDASINAIQIKFKSYQQARRQYFKILFEKFIKLLLKEIKEEDIKKEKLKELIAKVYPSLEP